MEIISTDTFCGWPEPRFWSESQQRIAAEYMAEKFSTQELRRRQRLNKTQTLYAHQQSTRHYDNRRYIKGLENLQIMFHVLAIAVDIIEFEQ